MVDLRLFPRNYEDARVRFLRHVSEVPGEKIAQSWHVPSRLDQDLHVDSLWLPPHSQAETLFVITSGIHGTESYAGSAVQNLFFEEFLPRLDRSQTGLLIVHGMNPFGFKHHRRGTENHVNLNRNFSRTGDIFRTRSERSRELNERFLTRAPVTSLRSRLLDSMRTEGEDVYFDDVTMDDFIKGTSLGQYESAEHLEFGGTGMEPQSEAFVRQLADVSPGFRNIVGLDVHTGLGDRGRLHLLIGGESETLHQDLFQRLFRVNEDQAIYEFTPPHEDGFYETLGAINGVFVECAASDQNICSLTMEFGTLGHSLEAQIDGLNRFVLEHQGRMFGYSSDSLRRDIERLNFERFYPQDDRWRVQVAGAARELFERVMARAGALPSSR